MATRAPDSPARGRSSSSVFDLQHVDTWTDMLRDSLDSSVGWYCDFRSEDETFVVFGGKVFRYPRGDPMGRAEAEDHARSIGVPEAQLDWPE